MNLFIKNLSLLILFSISATAQKKKVYIIVMDTLNNSPIENVRIQQTNDSKVYLTGNDGITRLKVNDENSQFILSHKDYGTGTFNLIKGQDTTVLALVRNSGDMGEVLPVLSEIMFNKEPKDLNRKAEPKGGLHNFEKNYLNKIVYPNEALVNNIEGEVIVHFLVNKDGTLSNVETIVGLGYGCDEEAERVIKESSPWIPAIRNGKAIKTRFVITVNFKNPF